MRLVLGVHQFLPEYSAGTEVLTYTSAKELQRRGYDVEVWTAFPVEEHLAENDRFDEYRYKGLPVRRYYHNYDTAAREQNVVESEYDNRFFGKHFAKYLKGKRPDIVHFFHLGRLSASPIEACSGQHIPTVFTPTDFWFMCPMNQLRLPGNALCPGPDRYGENCLRHVVAVTQPAPFRTLVRLAPSLLLRIAMWGSSQRWWPERKYSSFVHALGQRPRRLLEMMNKVDRILVPTLLMKGFMENFGVEPARIRFAPYGIARDRAAKRPPKRSDTQVRVGFVGTLAEHKGAHLLVRAFRTLPTDMPVALKIYGALDQFTDYGLMLRELAAADDRIEFCGTFPNNKVGEVMAGLDVLAVPSIWYENTPLVVYSAQAAGTPVVASDVGGLREAIRDGENGLLFRMGDTQALAAALARLVEDRSLLKKLAKGAVKPRSVAEYVDQLEEVYGEIAARGRRRQ